MSGIDVLAVNWWCQATRAPWTWTPKLYVGVWLMMAVILGTYGWAMRRRARAVGLDARDKRAILWFVLGAMGLWLATDWPLGLLGSGYLLSIHTTLYLIYTMVAAPLMLIGIPGWMARGMLEPAAGLGRLPLDDEAVDRRPRAQRGADLHPPAVRRRPVPGVAVRLFRRDAIG